MPAKAPTTTTISSGSKAESILSRTLFAPVLFVSFIFSILLVDRQASATLHPPSRYASHEEKEQYYRAHQRKLAKREMEDAFALRGRVIIAMCVATGAGIAITGWLLSEAWHFWNPYKSFQESVGV